MYLDQFKEEFAPFYASGYFGSVHLPDTLSPTAIAEVMISSPDEPMGSPLLNILKSNVSSWTCSGTLFKLAISIVLKPSTTKSSFPSQLLRQLQLINLLFFRLI